MDDYKKRYTNQRYEYEAYQDNMEKEIQRLTKKNMKLEKDMDVLTNIIQISQYINSYIRDKNLVNMINDMIIGVLGVNHCSIYIKDNTGKLIRNINTTGICNIEPTNEERKHIEEGTEYLFRSSKYIKICPTCKTKIKSSMGIPIKLRDKFIGYITVDHMIDLTEENRIFLNSISTQIAIALENSLLYRELSNIAKKDPLMGIYNRKYFFKRVEEMLVKNKDIEYAIVMLDLDNFKKVNDTFGHQYGDEVLKTVSKLIYDSLLENSIFARYGGEELIIYIYNYKEKDIVLENIESIRKKIEEKIITLGKIESKVTTSIGVAFANENTRVLSEIINKADNLLYEAKHKGKNMVVSE